MPVSDKHPDYISNHDLWVRCRDVYAGSDVVKSKGPVYLPMLSGQTKDEYRAYKQRALFYGITSKTVSVLVGMATIKPPVVEVPDEMHSYFKDRNGLQFTELWYKSLVDILLIGRIGLFIDAPATGGDPYIVTYPSENILNWESDEYDQLTMVVLHESFFERDSLDIFKKSAKTQYRVLRLVDGVYTCEIYDDKDRLVTSTVPLFRGKVLNYIPFFIATPFGLSTTIDKPPMLDIVDINLSHYLSSADLEHGRHFTGLPTPVAIGADIETELRIGSMTAWVIPDPNGDAKYLEFTGQGLQSLEKALTEKQSQLASLSARFIDNSTRGSEAVDAVRLRYLSETSSLSVNVRSTETLFNSAYRTIAEILGLDPAEVRINMDVDFLSNKLSAAEVKDLVDAFTSGGISKETLIYNLRRGERLPPNQSDDAEGKALDSMKSNNGDKGE